jgi:hypothetical protein
MFPEDSLDNSYPPSGISNLPCEPALPFQCPLDRISLIWLVQSRIRHYLDQLTRVFSVACARRRLQ